MKENRKLNTILFADIAGYTSLMQNDEVKAMKLLQIFKKILEQNVSKFEGLIVQYFGDACILSFDSTTLGVKCAISLQKDFRESNLPIRIGMHLGEVVFTENNVFGDGVNIASRIESMGVPGAILLSKTVRDQIKNKSEFELSSLGAFEFKNVKEPLEVYAITNPGFTLPPRSELKGKFRETPEKKRPKWLIPVTVASLVLIAIFILLYTLVPGLEISQDQTENSIIRKGIAVMPFQNLSPDNSDEFYCNGIMQNVLDNLSRIPEFIVLPSRTTNLYKDTQLLPTELGEELGVEYLIDGSFQKIDSLIQVTVALTSTHDGRQIWTNEKVTFSLPELFAMQAQIANQVANQLKTSLSDEINKSMENIPTRDELAYEYYLRGKDILKNFDEEFRTNEANIQILSDAKIYFNLAVERDSVFASAYLSLAKIEYNEKYTANILKDSTLFEYNRLVDKALQLDPQLSEGYLMKGMYADQELKAPSEAEKYLLKALDINPNNIDALYALSELYSDPKFDLVESIRLLKEIEYRTVNEEELYGIYSKLSNAYSKIMDRDMERYYVEKRIEINDSVPDIFIPWFYL
ncbi:adenylate/guanylate cyclase domain-containing protein, partial [uncultured Eudoraea sp.]|uniref:adenylate/guanylate cyclase domain-containing protein n=1 Tax=uncultured Eudoraea sp. TaxID=1035614 RepID=UPI00262BC32F